LVLNNLRRGVMLRKWISIFFVMLFLSGVILGLKSGTAFASDKLLYPVYIEAANKAGYIDEIGEIVITPIFDEAYEFSEGLAAVSNNGKYGYINTNGVIVIPFKFDFAREFSEGYAAVKVKEKWGFINKDGKLIIPAIYGLTLSFSDGLAGALLGSETTGFEFVYLNRKGNIDIRLGKEYHFGQRFVNGVAAVCTKYKCGYINKIGKLVHPIKYKTANSFSNGLALIMTNKYGYINSNWKIVIRPKFETADDFSCGLAAVRLKGKVGYNDEKGKTVIPFMYDYGGKFIGNLAEVRNKEKQITMYINKKNEVIWQGNGKLNRSYY